MFVNTKEEPKTTYINELLKKILFKKKNIVIIVGIGGGSTLDTAKAVSNLLTNGGMAEDYQGWDLVKKPGIYKVGIPTLSGTGAESSRTCVLINPEKNIKLGMNSDYSIFDQLILDPELTKSVDRKQYFYTGMDTYIHCVESLNGEYRNAIGDAFSREALSLCRKVFLSEDMMNDENRESMMVASYLGGCAIAFSFVGIIHPFSAGLSVENGLHHGVANCISMNSMKSFYPEAFEEFYKMAETQHIEIPTKICKDFHEEDFDKLYEATIIHEKPLSNALGEQYKKILNKERVIQIFQEM